ncbi:MAG TPA: hypothetical protein VEO54_31120 [Thermoanaerobaculia bacterium]|nr:hypothetical protein [Thermoanaerobaculia bacterium]
MKFARVLFSVAGIYGIVALFPQYFAEKFVFGLPTVLLYLQGRVAAAILVAALVDLALGLLFLAAYKITASVPSRGPVWEPA